MDSNIQYLIEHAGFYKESASARWATGRWCNRYEVRKNGCIFELSYNNICFAQWDGNTKELMWVANRGSFVYQTNTVIQLCNLTSFRGIEYRGLKLGWSTLRNELIIKGEAV